MIDIILKQSIERRWLVLIFVATLGALGIWNYQKLPIDAVPDITNVQVQINVEAEGYSPLEVEQRITYAIETAMAGIPDLAYTRSLSRYGLAQVTVVFHDGVDLYFARQLVGERLREASGQLPEGIEPMMGPIATGLGEIFQYTVEADPDARQPNGQPWDAMALRELQDWVIRPQLRQVPGVTEVNSIGGYDKQIHVTPAPAKLLAYRVSLNELAEALENNNANRGAGYIERNGEQYLVRVTGRVTGDADISNTVVALRGGIPVRVRDVAEVGVGRELRTGSATRDGHETVLGTAVMLIGENSRTVSERVATKLAEINKTLPPGVRAETVYNRTSLVERTIWTVQKNLIEGALLVVIVLLAFIGNLRATLIAAAVIPLAMLLTITGMIQNQVSANLMSLGALDFGLIVDAAVIILENCMRRLALAQRHHGRPLEPWERLHVTFEATREVAVPGIVSVLVVILVNLPILALTGVEGKMFQPMALTVIIAMIAALFLSVTFVPAAVAAFMTKPVKEHDSRYFDALSARYEALLRKVLARSMPWFAGAVLLVIGSLLLATRLGAEFIPSLDEGDVALQALRIPGTSLAQSLEMQKALEKELLTVPEVQTVFARVGTAEVATDPMPPSIADGYVILKPHDQWPDPDRPKAEVVEAINEAANRTVGSNFEMSQPIQLRFNELISGVRSDLAVKLYGDDLDQLLALGNDVAEALRKVPGAGDVKVEQVSGLPVLTVTPDRAKLARYGLNIADVQDTVATAIGGREAGTVSEGDRRFALVVRLPESLRNDLRTLGRLPIALPDGDYVPLAEVAKLELAPGPNQINRENGKRRIAVTANVRDRDLGSFVADVKIAVDEKVKLPPGIWITYGGTFEQLESAVGRLQLLVPVTLLMIFGLLVMTFRSGIDALLVFSGVPLALTGGVLALWLRGIPLSITAGVGFITLSGVAVLTGVVMVSAIRDLRDQGRNVVDAVIEGALMRLRPIIMVALVAALGFLPMALNTGTGAEVQRPLATVVIGGIISATLLSLFVLPALYRWAYRKSA